MTSEATSQTITKITVRPDGPYLVQGPIDLVDSDARAFTARGTVIALCRCGASTTKRFCDGTHSKIGFQAATKAVAEGEE